MTVISTLIIILFANLAYAQEPFDGGLPVIEINIAGGAEITDRDEYIDISTFVLTDPANRRHNFSRTGDKIKGRGNDSWYNIYAVKKSYRVKFKDKVPMFGLPAAKNWVLHAQYRDPTLLFNAAAFELGRRFGMPFNHSVKFVELYLNGEYRGVYLVTEHNEVGEGRVNIDKREGWLAEADVNFDVDPKFITEHYGLSITIKNSEADSLGRRGMNALTAVIARHDFPSNGYRDMINMDSFIDYFMINEICANDETAHPKSVFMYKDKNMPINMGPLWDFDWGFGHEGSAVTYFYLQARLQRHVFFERFFDDPIFLAKYKARWSEMYDEILSIPEYIDSAAGRLEKSAARNFGRWWYKTYEPWTDENPAEENDFLASVSSLKEWYAARIAYLDSQMNKIEIAPNGRIFDSRLSGYEDIPPQTFTLLSKGGVSRVSARLRRAAASPFMIDGKVKTSSDGVGGYYFTTVGVKPKNGLSAGVYSDALVMSGFSQGKQFSVEVTVSFTVKSEGVYSVIAVGPNPVSRRDGDVQIFREGARIESSDLAVYNALGDIVGKIQITDNGAGYLGRRRVGAWNVLTHKGARVAAGTYLLRGTVTIGGVSEAVWLKIGVR